MPPISAVAIGPKKLLRNSGISASTAAAAVRVIGPEAAHGCADDGLEAAEAGADILLDLVDQNHRVAHDDAKHGDGAQQRHKPERHVPNSSSAGTTPIRPSGAVSTTISTRLKLCSWIISRVSTAITMHRHLRIDRGLALPFSSTAPPMSMR